MLIKYAKNGVVWCKNVIDRKFIDIKIDAILINHKKLCYKSAKNIIEYKMAIYRGLLHNTARRYLFLF